jgi:hypothetical protein
MTSKMFPERLGASRKRNPIPPVPETQAFCAVVVVGSVVKVLSTP